MPRKTKLIEQRKPTDKEKRDHHAEVVFIRKDEDGREYIIYAAKCYESCQQWGAHTEVLCDNVSAVESWRHRTA